mgnify:CR=1 FL=1
MKPQLYNINTFDASKECEFRFVWEGNQSFGNICIIRDNITNDIVYQKPQTTMQLKHILPANSLINGKLYNVSIASKDINDEVSEYSSPVLFYCFTTPNFKFINVSDNQTIRNATYQVNMSYSQIEGEPLESYVIEMLDNARNILQSSGIIYGNDLRYTFTNLEDNQTYYIRATGRTLNGMEIETDYIFVSVNYEQPQIYSILTLENIKDDGLIKIQSNIRIVECNTTKAPVFIDGEFIDLRNDTLTINDGFSLDDDYIIRCVGYDIKHGLIMTIGNVHVYFRKYGINSYVELYAPFHESNYYCYSNYIENLKSTEKIEIFIIKKGRLYDVKIERSS